MGVVDEVVTDGAEEEPLNGTMAARSNQKTIRLVAGGIFDNRVFHSALETRQMHRNVTLLAELAILAEERDSVLAACLFGLGIDVDGGDRDATIHGDDGEGLEDVQQSQLIVLLIETFEGPFDGVCAVEERGGGGRIWREW